MERLGGRSGGAGYLVDRAGRYARYDGGNNGIGILHAYLVHVYDTMPYTIPATMYTRYTIHLK